MGFLDELRGSSLNTDSNNEDLAITDAAIESELFLFALRDECNSDAEFASVLEEAGVEMALYDLIDDADAAMEAAKKIVVQDFKTANLNRIVKRTAIRLAQKDDSNEYKMYKKYRTLALEARDKIYRKYESRARSEAKRIIANARSRSANMSSNTGKDITSRMDAQIAKMNGK